VKGKDGRKTESKGQNKDLEGRKFRKRLKGKNQTGRGEGEGRRQLKKKKEKAKSARNM